MNACPGSPIEQAALQESIARFLRTHTSGYALLLNFLASVPPDRTELDWTRERESEFVAPRTAIASMQFTRQRADAVQRVKREGF